MLIQHVKGYPDPSTYSKNKGGITLDTDCETPCIYRVRRQLADYLLLTFLSNVAHASEVEYFYSKQKE